MKQVRVRASKTVIMKEVKVCASKNVRIKKIIRKTRHHVQSKSRTRSNSYLFTTTYPCFLSSLLSSLLYLIPQRFYSPVHMFITFARSPKFHAPPFSKPILSGLPFIHNHKVFPPTLPCDWNLCLAL